MLDALPSFMFLVDEDVRVLDYNRAAGALLNAEAESVLRRRGGDALHCLHHREHPDGCGRAEVCGDCPVRGAVRQALASGQPARLRGRLDLVRGPQVQHLLVLVLAAPVAGSTNRAMVVVDDIGLLTERQRLIPVCSCCRRVRDEQDQWISFDSYFSAHLSVGFSHGYCPECGVSALANLEAELSGTRPTGTTGFADRP